MNEKLVSKIEKSEIDTISGELESNIQNIKEIVTYIQNSGKEDVVNQAIENNNIIKNKIKKILEGCAPILLTVSNPASTLVRRLTKLLEQPQLPDLQSRGIAPYIFSMLTIMAVVETIRPVSEFVQNRSNNQKNSLK